MRYSEWLETVPEEIRNDLLWRMEVYRRGLFMGELAWLDVSALAQDRRTLSIADQLNRAVGAISANIAEGYSRSSGRDRVRFYEYALGSARESRDWYFKARQVLGEPVATHRIRLLTSIARLLLTTIPDQRSLTVAEEQIVYSTVETSTNNADLAQETCADDLLERVPLPNQPTNLPPMSSRST